MRHAHGFVVQTLADLGLVGLILALALLFTWMAATGRATHPFNRRWSRWRTWLNIRSGEGPGWRRLTGELTAYPPERVGMLSMLCVVVVFGAHSLVDWTWYVPGDAAVALLCAGWLAGRGPLSASPGMSAPEDDALSADAGARKRGLDFGPPLGSGRRRAIRACSSPAGGRRRAAGGVVAVAAAALGTTRQDALALLASNPLAASAEAHAAVVQDPLSAEALFTLADVQQASGHQALARATLAASGAPAAVEPADVARTGALRPCERPAARR